MSIYCYKAQRRCFSVIMFMFMFIVDLCISINISCTNQKPEIIPDKNIQSCCKTENELLIKIVNEAIDEFSNGRCVFLGMGTDGKSDPDECVMDKLSHSGIELKKISNAIIDRNGVRDRDTNECGIIIRVWIKYKLSDNKIVYAVDYTEGLLSGGGHEVTVIKNNGIWTFQDMGTNLTKRWYY